MRYYIKCKLDRKSREKLADSINSGSLAKGKIFYEGMQAALRSATIDETDTVHFIEACYCLEGGLYPMAMEIPTLKEYFESVEEVKDARFREKCTMECEACDCTRAIKLPGMPLVKKLNLEDDDIGKKEILDKLGLSLYESVKSVKENARCSLAGSDRYSNIV